MAAPPAPTQRWKRPKSTSVPTGPKFRSHTRSPHFTPSPLPFPPLSMCWKPRSKFDWLISSRGPLWSSSLTRLLLFDGGQSSWVSSVAMKKLPQRSSHRLCVDPAQERQTKVEEEEGKRKRKKRQLLFEGRKREREAHTHSKWLKVRGKWEKRGRGEGEGVKNRKGRVGQS